MKSWVKRVLIALNVGATVTNMFAANADPQPMTSGGLQEAFKSVSRARELMQIDPQDSALRRLGNRAKGIRFRMLVSKPGANELPPEYAWSTKARPKGAAPQVVYPYAELIEGAAGRATVRFRINHEGQVDLSMVLEATKPEFGHAAQAALETMTFTPAKKKDKSPAMVLCDAEFEFAPDGSGDVLVPQEVGALLKNKRINEAVVVAVAGLDARLKPINTSKPIYPSALAKAGTVGTTTVEFVVTESGWVALPRVISASQAEFGAAAVQAVSVWKFEPPVMNGRIVNALARIEIEFNPIAR